MYYDVKYKFINNENINKDNQKSHRSEDRINEELNEEDEDNNKQDSFILNNDVINCKSDFTYLNIKVNNDNNNNIEINNDESESKLLRVFTNIEDISLNKKNKDKNEEN